MKKILLELSEELADAIDAARDGSRNPAIESWLWRIGDIRDAAKRIGVDRPIRRGRGRPPKQTG